MPKYVSGGSDASQFTTPMRSGSMITLLTMFVLANSIIAFYYILSIK